MEITCIRHTSVDVPPGYCYGQTDVALKASFEEEATQVAAQLAGEKFDRVYTSPLSRCTRLAARCGYAGAVREPRLQEMNFGRWEMTPFSDLTGQEAAHWFHNWLHTATPEGESFLDLYARVSAFLEELRRSDIEKAAVFTHGGVITCARIYAGHYPAEKAFEHIPGYGEIVKLTV